MSGTYQTGAGGVRGVLLIPAGHEAILAVKGLTALGYIPGVLYACCVIGCDHPPPAPVAAVEQL